MRPLSYCPLLIAVTWGLAAANVCAQRQDATPSEAPTAKTSPFNIPAKHHPWGRFEPGAWKRVRMVAETLDERGMVKDTSTTETKTTLLEVCDDHVTLEQEVVHEVSGKRFAREPQIITQGFHGEPVCNVLKVGEPRVGQVVIEGRTIPCKIIDLQCNAPGGKSTVTLYYSPTVAPYILKRDVVTTDLESEGPTSQMTMDVVALHMRWWALPDLDNAVYVQAVRKHPKGRIATWIVTSTEVPGGVISHWSKEYDGDDRLIRRNRLELISYDLRPEPSRIGLFRIKRRGAIRRTRPALRYLQDR